MRFTINAKAFKEVIEKATTCTHPKGSIDTVKTVFFKATKNEVVAYATDIEQWIQLEMPHAYNIEPGVCGIHLDDTKIATKVTGEVTLEANNGLDITLKFGKKKLTMPDTCRFVDDAKLPDGNGDVMFTASEEWLYETLTNLMPFTFQEDRNNIMKCFNFNLKQGRVEALDGHVIGMRRMETNGNEKIMFNNMAVKPLKKILDKKSYSQVSVMQNDKYITLVGNDFTYIQRRTEGIYYDIQKMLIDNYDWRFTTERKPLLDIMKYDMDLIKDCQKPVVINVDDEVQFYCNSSRYESLDEIDASDIKGNTTIGFNPKFFVNALNCSEFENVILSGTNYKAPIYMELDDYDFMILPVNIKNLEYLKAKFKEVA